MPAFFMRSKMKFRPCIDLHNGKVKQIVGSSLSDQDPSGLKVNFTADQPSSWFARKYRQDNLRGGHIIMLGPGNVEAACQALESWPGGMQIGGGINAENGAQWLERGASHVIVTSWVFRDGMIDEDRLTRLVAEVGKERLVLDLSCRRKGSDYFIVTDRWQKFTEVNITADALAYLSGFCDEFLIHAADVEGKCDGIEVDLVKLLAQWVSIPTTYAGGIRGIDDLELIRAAGSGKLDATIGSALDIFGGSLVAYDDVVAFHRKYGVEHE